MKSYSTAAWRAVVTEHLAFLTRNTRLQTGTLYAVLTLCDYSAVYDVTVKHIL
jgi:hypothetical protein